MPGYVLDTSALLALFRQEKGAEEVVRILGSDREGMVHEVGGIQEFTVYLPFVALMELEYWFLRQYGPYETDTATRLMLSWRVTLVESYPDWRRAAARVKSAAGLSLADAWNASLALLLDAELVHKDPEFDRVEGLRSLRLPYKPKTR
ncbi:MAG TPA: PIN domain-containing protein [Thermoanaerobaculia bacterium]|nr:PIN domain-containing protein [Thermoanaerobaculia bacterium]